MAFQLNSVVPWGRNFAEYREMFQLTEADFRGKIASFGDGPASFNREATQKGYDVTSFDPLYGFSKAQIARRIAETRETVMEQMAQNRENYVWDSIPDLKTLETRRMDAMERFLADYDAGRAAGRYVAHALPDRLPCEDNAFSLGLSSHFLLLYPGLGLDFHRRAIAEMLRVCREVRIYPTVDLDGNPTALAAKLLAHFQKDYEVALVETTYRFQKGATAFLRIRKV